MQVFLYYDVAATGELGVLLADYCRVNRRLFHGIFCAVNEADQVAIVEVIEAVYFVHNADCATEPRDNLRRQFKAQIHARRANMEENVARRCNRVMLSADFTERMQTVWPRRPEQAVPCVGTEAEDAGELT